MMRVDRVAEQQPSPVRIYDYYEPSKYYHTVATIPTFSGKLVERDKVDILDIHIHSSSLSWLSTDRAIKIVAGFNSLYASKLSIL